MLPYFHTLYLEATRTCNFACDNCSSGSHLKEKWKGVSELSYDDICNRILIPAFNIGTRYIEFSGGEFLLRKDALDLLEFASKNNFVIGIASNGTTLNDSKIKILKQLLGDNLLISLGVNSFKDLENKKTRDVETNKVLDVIQRLETHHVRMNICVTMGKHTADDFAETIKKIRELKLPHNRIPYSPRNSCNYDLMFDKKILKEKLHPSLRKYFHGYVSFVPFFLNPDAHAKYSGQTNAEYNVPTNPSVGCWCGSFYSVTPDGEVAPCPLLGDHVSGGNVLKTDLKEILFESDIFKKIVRRNEFSGKCGKCKYNFTCGGCRTMAYFQGNDLYGEDPTCFIDELSEEELHAMEIEFEAQFRNYVRMAKFGGMYQTPDVS
ncbi:MAG: hypothetical protein A2275_13930 [Bacteroidetes bacterium RIFOXYA12_FULL_35_11]|nr:MAG: hypothetical protein A2X01_13155 [Bacteroidetes bacterium GWF2_35_48]OFY80409.1 MAG: hypothetical protein A2275_13930 [Bacteroidetes bacterium RIFOXYA12_FULL_35_11]OFY96639.1 MAG: hypothetical protein A2309_05600 [Bacteroidetes bacterium RIFOXYB2_FULL_35_7]HBX51859.1 hypothetical protein [Bacteroidales bacterium]